MRAQQATTFSDRLNSRRGRLLTCYLPVGDPMTRCATPQFYADHGVDVVEAGIAVTNPVLDGPVVSSSMQRARSDGQTTADAAQSLRAQLDSTDIAAVWMSYCSEPSDDYLELVASSGVDGVLLPDADDQVDLLSRAARANLDMVPFVSHAPAEGQIRAAVRARGYVMLAAADGVTGGQGSLAGDNKALIERLRASGVSAPILLGFGISTPNAVRAARDMGADGVIVGSECIRAARIGSGALGGLLTSLRRALDE